MFMRAKTVVGQSYGRLGAFVQEVTELAKQKQAFQVGPDRCVMIRNVKPYPVENLIDPMKYVVEGLNSKGMSVDDVDHLLDGGRVKKDVRDALSTVEGG